MKKCIEYFAASFPRARRASKAASEEEEAEEEEEEEEEEDVAPEVGAAPTRHSGNLALFCGSRASFFLPRRPTGRPVRNNYGL
jgi:CO dehydrogenase/acetyl-CoA synthase beta subunit